jgi:predicted lipase
MQSQSEQTTRILKEAIIRDQLTRMLPDIEKVYLVFCAYELSMQIHGFRFDPKFEGGKC